MGHVGPPKGFVLKSIRKTVDRYRGVAVYVLESDCRLFEGLALQVHVLK